MKKLSLAVIIASTIILSACNGNSSSSNNMDTDSTATMNSTTNDTSSMAKVGEDAINFAQEAATGGMMEVQLGKIAQTNSSTQSIKDFGEMMVDDHTKIINDLKDLADKKNISLPTTVTSEQQEDIDKLSKETGSEFDKDYVSMMVEGHKKVIDAFTKAGDNIKDPDIKSFIIMTLPIIQKHLDEIESIQKKM